MLFEVIIFGSAVYGMHNILQKRQAIKNTVKNSKLPTKLHKTSVIQENKCLVKTSRRNIDNQHKFNIALISFVFAISSVIINPIFRLLSILGIFYNGYFIASDAYHAVTQEKKVSIEVINIVIITMLVSTNQVILATMPVLLTTLRKKLVAKVKYNSHQAITNAYQVQPDTAWLLLVDGDEINIPCEQLKVGQTIIIHGGEIVPVDGTIIEGYATIDQHILTGESQAIERESKDPVFASTTVLRGRIRVIVEKIGNQSVAAQIANILENTIDTKTNMQLQAEDKIDNMMLPLLMVSTSLLPVIGIYSTIGLLHTLPRDNITIASAISILNIIRLASQEGILIKDGRILEQLNQVDTIIFDKTGTLTTAQPHVLRVVSFGKYTKHDVLSYAAASEYRQKHPIATAICDAAKAQKLKIPEVHDIQYHIGFGLQVSIKNKMLLVGSLRLMELNKIEIPSILHAQNTEVHKNGNTLIVVAFDQVIIGYIEIEPTIRPEASYVIKKLHKDHIKFSYIISGDKQESTNLLKETLGINDCFAEVLPKQKADIIKQLQNEGRSVCFVGDGINDAIALKQADVSISLSDASTIAKDTAQVILMDKSLSQLTYLFEIAETYQQKMQWTYWMIGTPTSIGAFSAIFLNTGFATSLIFGQVGFLSGLTNALHIPSNQSLEHSTT